MSNPTSNTDHQRHDAAREIPLTKGKVAFVDDEDFARVSRFKWHAHQRRSKKEGWYAIRNDRSNGVRRSVYLHRFILSLPEGISVDHRDGNGLNCRKSNLRVATLSQNQHNRGLDCRNTSGYKGVSRLASGQYQASLMVRRRSYYGGRFSLAEDAARAYDRLAKQHHGEFARLNFPKEMP